MGHTRNRARIVGRHQHGVSSGGIGKRLSQSSRGQHAIGQVALVDQQQVDISRQREMLKPVVEHVDGHAKITFGALATGKTVGADEDRNDREQPREQQRFVARGAKIGHDLPAV